MDTNDYLFSPIDPYTPLKRMEMSFASEEERIIHDIWMYECAGNDAEARWLKEKLKEKNYYI